jgi:hypothetical protein
MKNTPTIYAWQEDCLYAVLERDEVKREHSLYEAIAAIEQRLLSPVEPDSEEAQALKEAQRAMDVLRGAREN